MKNVAVLLLLMCGNALASESYLKAGTGVANSARYSSGETKIIALGYSKSFFDALSAMRSFAYQLEVGLWADSQQSSGRRSSGYASFSPGLDLHAGPFKASSYHGAGVITATDVYLGSNLQFFHDISMGLEDDVSKAGISIGYKHISNAGVFSDINQGRDFMFIRLSAPW